MSITFSIDSDSHGYMDLQLNNRNAHDLLAWLGYRRDWCGELEPGDLIARCMRRTWDVERNHDKALPDEAEGNAVIVGRRPGYLREKTEQLLVIAKEARRLGKTVVFG